MRRLSQGDGLDRLRLRELRRLGPLPHHGQRLPHRRQRRDLQRPGRERRQRDRPLRLGEPVGISRQQRRRDPLHAALLDLLHLRLQRLDAGRLHVRRRLQRGAVERFLAQEHADGHHPRAELHDARVKTISRRRRRMPSRRQFVGSVGAGLLLAPFITWAWRAPGARLEPGQAAADLLDDGDLPAAVDAPPGSRASRSSPGAT